MPFLVTEKCIGVRDLSCIDVCPVDCIYPENDRVGIHPEECIDCGLCELVCPVSAIVVFRDDDPGSPVVAIRREQVK